MNANAKKILKITLTVSFEAKINIILHLIFGNKECNVELLFLININERIKN